MRPPPNQRAKLKVSTEREFVYAPCTSKDEEDSTGSFCALHDQSPATHLAGLSWDVGIFGFTDENWWSREKREKENTTMAGPADEGGGFGDGAGFVGEQRGVSVPGRVKWWPGESEFWRTSRMRPG